MHDLKELARRRRATDSDVDVIGINDETGVATRELFRHRLERQWERCAQDHLYIGLLLIKVDGLDTAPARTRYERANARAIRAVARIASDCARRRADFVGRLRYDEFGVMLVESDTAGAREVGEHILAGVREARIALPEADRPVTVSIACGSAIPIKSRFASSLLISTNLALEKAIREGGDRISVYTDA